MKHLNILRHCPVMKLQPKDEAPAAIELLLNSGSFNAGGSNDENKVQLYQINATVRGGNKCADRLL